MKVIYDFYSPPKTKFIKLNQDRGGEGPEFSNDKYPLPPDLVEEGRNHFPIISDKNTEIIRNTCSQDKAKTLLDALKNKEASLTIIAVRVVERLVAQVIAPNKFAPISIKDHDQLCKALNKNPEAIVRDTIKDIQESTGMIPYFVGRCVAYELSTKP